MSEQEKKAVQAFNGEREQGKMLRGFFEQMFYEFQALSRKKPNSVVNRYKVERINRVLKPLKEMMKEEEYACFLETIEEPEETENPDGTVTLKGRTYSDVALMMTQFKSALNRWAAAAVIGKES